MNTITIAGNLGKDAEQVTTKAGKPMVKFSVADSKGKDSPTTWFSCSWVGDRAAKVAQYLTKGSKVTVSGSLDVTKKDDGRVFFDVFVNDVALQGGKQEGSSSYGTSGNGASAKHTGTPDNDYSSEGGDSPF
jgi:single-strand DNA-binding protein